MSRRRFDRRYNDGINQPGPIGNWDNVAVVLTLIMINLAFPIPGTSRT